MTHLTRTILLLLALPALLPAQDVPKKALPKIEAGELTRRRTELMKAFPASAIVIDAGILQAGMEGVDSNTPVFDFFYLTGFHDDKGILVLFTGPREEFVFSGGDAKALAARSGIPNVLPIDKFPGFAKEVLPSISKFRTKVRKATKTLLKEAAPDAEFATGVDTAVTRLRVLKSDAELAMMRKSADATNKAELAAMKACKPGMNEGDLQKVIEDTFKAEDCDGLAFPTIVGSGKNGTILHYMANKEAMPPDSLVVCDIGASYHGYATDITRTLPTSGTFNDAQRKAYQCVLDAQRAAEEILKPGVTFGDLEERARKVFEERNLTDWSYAHSRDMSVRHGLGHFVGLAVHDSGIYQEGLKPGMVVTIEPGYYSKKAGWGIRIEDIYVVTKDGFERLSAGCPREIAEIEKLMKK